MFFGVLVTCLAICQCLRCSASGEKSYQKKSVCSNNMERQHNGFGQHRTQECQSFPYIFLNYCIQQRHCLFLRMITLASLSKWTFIIPNLISIYLISQVYYMSPQLKPSLKLLIFQFLEAPSVWTQQYALYAHPFDHITPAPQPRVSSSFTA